MTRTVDVATSHTPLAELVSLALSGTEVVLTDGEKPVARLVPIASGKKPRVAGRTPGLFRPARILTRLCRMNLDR